MRRFISLFIITALLSVSSVPLVSAVACEMPAAVGMSSDEGAHDHHAMMMPGEMNTMPHSAGHSTKAAMQDMHAGHDHSAALSGDWQRCRIECGCGCHRSIDSLPHLLAPHSADSGFQSETASVERAVTIVPAKLQARILSLSSPPPDFL